MARHKLENELIAIEVEEHGAELKSLVRKNTGKEYMWKADPKFWGRTSPVLFPFVGAVKDKQFRTKGQTYTMGQHGFARDMDFTLDSQTEDTLWFVLKSNEETMAKYPYAFTLRIGYHIEGNKLEVLWQVENPSEEELPFSIGGHPAFNRPKNCKIRFDVDLTVASPAPMMPAPTPVRAAPAFCTVPKASFNFLVLSVTLLVTLERLLVSPSFIPRTTDRRYTDSIPIEQSPPMIFSGYKMNPTIYPDVGF